MVGMTGLNEAAKLLISSDWALLLLLFWGTLTLAYRIGHREGKVLRTSQVKRLREKVFNLEDKLEESEEKASTYEELYFELLQKKESS